MPNYECQNCIGMKEHGCYCQAMGAIAPGGPAASRQEVIRERLVWIENWCNVQHFDPYGFLVQASDIRSELLRQLLEVQLEEFQRC